MTRIHGGTRVKKGYYFHMRGWAMQLVASDGEALPGTAADAYFHVPVPLVLVVAPLMGAALVVFLPFIGFVLVGQAAVRPLGHLFRRSAAEMAATVQPGWKPGEAHLAGRRGEGEHEPAKREAPEDELSELEREIAAKRRSE